MKIRYLDRLSVYAGKSGATKVTSVDLSNTYLSWAKKNFALNGLNAENEKYEFINGDVKSFLQRTKEKYDIIILDPPTFSNSKKTQTERSCHIFTLKITSAFSQDGHNNLRE